MTVAKVLLGYTQERYLLHYSFIILAVSESREVPVSCAVDNVFEMVDSPEPIGSTTKLLVRSPLLTFRININKCFTTSCYVHLDSSF